MSGGSEISCVVVPLSNGFHEWTPFRHGITSFPQNIYVIRCITGRNVTSVSNSRGKAQGQMPIIWNLDFGWMLLKLGRETHQMSLHWCASNCHKSACSAGKSVSCLHQISVEVEDLCEGNSMCVTQHTDHHSCVTVYYLLRMLEKKETHFLITFW
jgi:hypothetical protein